jgi:hypothetical protein
VRDARLHCVRYFSAEGRLADHFENDLVAVMPEDFVKILDLMEACLSPSGIKVENVKVAGYEHDCLCIMFESASSFLYGVRGLIIDAEDYEAIKLAGDAAITEVAGHMDIDMRLRYLYQIESAKKHYSSADGLYK